MLLKTRASQKLSTVLHPLHKINLCKSELLFFILITSKNIILTQLDILI